ncbi:MAG: ATPase [Rhodobacteraceae bacterium]|nr:ATPase [Paracoccaceae bacterium]
MIYQTAKAWQQAEQKRILLFGMSGVGKTHLANMLRDCGDWFHYSVDYRIGTRYMGEEIVDNFRREAMKNPFLAGLLKSDSICLESKITFKNLDPLSTYLGKPGSAEQGGIPFAEYCRRQTLHREGEIAALRDTIAFIHKAQDIYRYRNFVCDSGGSICEVIDPDNPADALMALLSHHILPVWIRGSDDLTQELVKRFNRSPKPMYYEPDFLQEAWDAYLAAEASTEDTVDPNAFIRWTFARVIARRTERYEAMAHHWGVTVASEDVVDARDERELVDLIAHAIDRRASLS